MEVEVGIAGVARGKRSARLKSLQGRHAVDDVGAGSHQHPIAGAAAGGGRAEGISFGKQRRGQGSLPQDASLHARQQQPAEAGMGRQADEFPAEGLDPVFGVDRPQHEKEPPGVLQGLCGWGIEPGEIGRLSQSQQLQESPGQIAPQNLRNVGCGAMVVGGFVP